MRRRLLLRAGRAAVAAAGGVSVEGGLVWRRREELMGGESRFGARLKEGVAGRQGLGERKDLRL
jgi:hypothetical protein